MQTARSSLSGGGFLLFVLLAACGAGAGPTAQNSQTSVIAESTSSISDTTTTTVFKGNVCKREVPRQVASKFPQETKDPEAVVNAFISYRSYIRILDLETVKREQTAFVDALREFISAFNRFIATQGQDQSVRDAQVPLRDALEDFVTALVRECSQQ